MSAIAAICMISSCERLDNDPEVHHIALDEVARLLSAIPLKNAQLTEVHDAVTSSSGNGYDEEYTMTNLFMSPGAGVGDGSSVRSNDLYERPLREIIEEYLCSPTKSATDVPAAAIDNPEAYLKRLEASDVQIYWPYSEEWDGHSFPVISFDPEDNSEVNIGYEIILEDDGTRHVEEVLVDEEMAKERPVWVVNRNSDAGYTSLEMLRRKDPDWGEGGGTIIVRPSESNGGTKAQGELKTLILKDFVMNRNYDSWFAGASEFFVKIGSVEDFTAVTEAELKIYNPTVTDFMIVVRRNQVGISQPFNAVLVSEWTPQLTHCALMITEDDGGTLEKWDCSAIVKINSKSYGFDISIPFNRRDDIVWRGQLTSRWIEANSSATARFGDLDLTFEVLDYQ